jgi:hypothetical protein
MCGLNRLIANVLLTVAGRQCCCGYERALATEEPDVSVVVDTNVRLPLKSLTALFALWMKKCDPLA